jgi:transcriptional regulator with XRE-family HTH domain
MTPHEFLLWRVCLGLTQAGAAAQLGKSASTISRYETGHTPVPRSVVLLCEALSNNVKEPEA